MNCRHHNDKEAKYMCESCKQPICEDCTVDLNGNKICKSCVGQAMNVNSRRGNGDGFFYNIFFFCCAAVPGAAQMFMGLFKRGFQIMFTFILGMVLFSYVNLESFIPLLIIPLWFYSFFDSYHIRKRLRNGEKVEDRELIDYRILFANKEYIGLAMLILGAIGLINALGNFEFMGRHFSEFYWMMRRGIVPFILLLAGVLVLIKSKNLKNEDM